MSELRIVYHGNCIDGFASFYIYRQSMPTDTLIRQFPVSPNDPRTWPADPEAHVDVVLLDVCLPREVMDRWKAAAKSLKVIDHHETSADCVSAMGEHAHYSNDHCATYLTFQHLYPDTPVPDWIHMVERIDLWKGVTTFDRSMRELLHPIAALPVQCRVIEALDQFRAFVEAYSTVSPTMLDLIAEGTRRLIKKQTDLELLLLHNAKHAVLNLNESHVATWGLSSEWIGRTVFIADTTRMTLDTTEAAQYIFERIPGVQCFINYRLASWFDKGTSSNKYKYTYCARSMEGIDLTADHLFEGHRCAAGGSKMFMGTPLPFIIG